MSQEALARRLRVLRAEHGLTLRQVAQLSGVDKVTLLEAEHGRRKPYSTTLAKIAKVYGIPTTELLNLGESAETVGVGKDKDPQSGQVEITKEGGVIRATVTDTSGVTDEVRTKLHTILEAVAAHEMTVEEALPRVVELVA